MISSIHNLVLCSHLAINLNTTLTTVFGNDDRLVGQVFQFNFSSISSLCLTMSSSDHTVWQDCDLLKINL